MLNTYTLPSPIQESISSVCLVAKPHHILLSRFARVDNLVFNAGRMVTRIALEKMGFIQDQNENGIPNKPLQFTYSKRSYQLMPHAGRTLISSLLLDTSVENVALQVESLQAVAAVETQEVALIKTLLSQAPVYPCTLGSTSVKNGPLTELNAKDLDQIFVAFDQCQITSTNPEVMFGSDWYGTLQQPQETYAIVVPSDYYPSLREMIRNNLAIAVEKYARSDYFQDPNEIGCISNFKVYRSTLMRQDLLDPTASTTDKKTYYGLVFGNDTFVTVDGLSHAECVYQSRAMQSEAAYVSIGKRFYTGSGILRPQGVYSLQFTDYVKA